MEYYSRMKTAWKWGGKYGVVLGNHQVIVKKKGRYKKNVWTKHDISAHMSMKWGGYFFKVHWKNSLKCRFEIWAKLAQSIRSFLLKPNEQNFFLGGIRIKAEKVKKYVCGHVEYRVWVEQGTRY